MGEKKVQHYIPRCILKHHARQGRKPDNFLVWQHDVHDNLYVDQSDVSIYSICNVCRLYEFSGKYNDLKYLNLLENCLAKQESKEFDKVVLKFCNHESFCDGDESRFYNLVATQLLRTPAYIDFSQEFARQYGFDPNTARDVSLFSSILHAECASLDEFIIEHSHFAVCIEMLPKGRIEIWCTGDDYFFINDFCPVLFFDDYSGYAGRICAFPVAFNRCVVLTNDGKFTDGVLYKQICKEDVMHMNSGIWASANRFVYSKYRISDVDKNFYSYFTRN